MSRVAIVLPQFLSRYSRTHAAPLVSDPYVSQHTKMPPMQPGKHEGCSMAQIATQRGITDATVQTHRATIRDKQWRE